MSYEDVWKEARQRGYCELIEFLGEKLLEESEKQ